MRASQNVWCVKVGEIVKVYWSHERTEITDKMCYWFVGKVLEQERGRAVVELLEDDPLHYDRYLEKENVVFSDGFKFVRQRNKYLKSRKILSINRK